jgi:hypothetical protein
MTRLLARGALLLSLACASVCACGAASEGRARGSLVSADGSPRIEDAFDGEPEALVVVRPRRLVRDPLYGPLLRRVSELASERAAVASAVGTTAFAALERAEEVVVASYDLRAGDAVVGVRGVPADVEASRVVDTGGAALWAHARELPGGVEELAATDPSVGASLFVLPRRSWVIAAGPAVARVRRSFSDGGRRGDAHLGAVDPDALAVARLRPDVLVRARPQLSSGPLAPIARDLDTATLSLAPGPEGQVGEVAARFVYGDAPFATGAESSFRDVLSAFVRAYEAKAPWLHAVTVAREDRAVVVRGRIPRAWVDGFLRVDLGHGEGDGADGADGAGDGAPGAEKPQQIPHHGL